MRTQRALMTAPEFVNQAKERERLERAVRQATLRYAMIAAEQRPPTNTARREAERALLTFDHHLEADYEPAVLRAFNRAYDVFRAMRQQHVIDWDAYMTRNDDDPYDMLWFLRWCALRQEMDCKEGVDLGLAASRGEDVLQEFLEGYADMMEDN